MIDPYVFDNNAPPDQGASAIEDGANLVESIFEAGRRAPVRGDGDVFVDYIRFIDEDEAEAASSSHLAELVLRS